MKKIFFGKRKKSNIEEIPEKGPRARKKALLRGKRTGLSAKLDKNFLGLYHCDFALVLSVTILVLFGIVMVFSASYYYSISREGTPYAYLIKQGVYSVGGFIIMAFFSVYDYNKLSKYSWILLVGNIVLLLLLFTPLGINVNGATRWLKIGVSVMPGELAKFTMIIYGATFFSGNLHKGKKIGKMLPLIFITALICGLIIKQPNLSTAITVAVIVVGMAFLAEFPWRYIFTLFFSGLGGMVAIGLFGRTYHRDRVMFFLDPFKNTTGQGYQVVQSLLALGSGGMFGVGIGKSVEKTLYLPEPHTDFILAIIGEELGLVGVIFLIITFMILIWRCFVISMNASNSMGMLLAGGIGIMIAVQVILNLAIVTSSMPPTGVALPFVSYGGNSLWIFMALIGIVLNVSRKNSEEKA